MRYFEAEGYAPQEILKEFLAQQKLPEDFVDMEILEHGSKGFLGIGRKKAKVRLKFDDGEYLKRKAKLYLSEILDKAGFDYSIDIKKEGDDIFLNILSQDSSVLIGKNAVTLDSLQYLTERATKMDGSDINILVDVDSYRNRVIEPLKEKALKLAQNVKKTGKPAKLPPMATMVRREIHIAAKSIEGIHTVSHGEGQVKSLTILSDRKSSEKKGKPSGQKRDDSRDSRDSRPPAKKPYKRAYRPKKKQTPSE